METVCSYSILLVYSSEKAASDNRSVSEGGPVPIFHLQKQTAGWIWAGITNIWFSSSLPNFQLREVQPNKTYQRRALSDEFGFLSMCPIYSTGTLAGPFAARSGWVGRSVIPGPLQLAQKHAERDIMSKVTSDTGIFILGWPGCWRKLVALNRGSLDGPEWSPMQAGCHVDCPYSEAQNLCTTLGASGQTEGKKWSSQRRHPEESNRMYLIVTRSCLAVWGIFVHK